VFHDDDTTPHFFFIKGTVDGQSFARHIWEDSDDHAIGDVYGFFNGKNAILCSWRQAMAPDDPTSLSEGVLTAITRGQLYSLPNNLFYPKIEKKRD
jgi:hypothetical protein